ncbi:anhydro-N-acetylmuramic acid kinase [Sedimenticola sp.]|uniref:anhydro-N-acetylmuramic acid kinase n=1 Tax=Sedimenticola sp. TaxID=1940285 RepID=UPI003D0C8163
MAEYYVGLMSGTSMDALDAVVIDLAKAEPVLHGSLSRTFPDELRQQLLDLAQPGANEIDRSARADRQLGVFAAETVQQLLSESGIDASSVRAIGSHGQTIRHAPQANPPYTLQIGDPNTIAQLAGITTVADFRRRDMVVGGQAAPLVPAFHEAIYRNTEHDRIALNLGGIANITVLPADPSQAVIGFDTGPANGLMDAWCQYRRNEAFDPEGRGAASGKVNMTLLSELESDPYFAQPPPKSTGREHFNLDWFLPNLPPEGLSDEDVLATLCELSARTVAAAIKEHAANSSEVIVCGGGAYNAHLLQRLKANLPDSEIVSSETYGIEPRWIEAMAFAWLAQRTLQHLPGNLPSVTGAREAVILGAIYPGKP